MNFPFRKALVTGGAGFIGSHLIERLLGLGLEVVSIDNYVTGRKENLQTLACPQLHDIECCVTNYDLLKEQFPGVDIVFHNAASKKTVCMDDPRYDLDVNARGTYNILELSRDFGVKKVVHASTGSVYGEGRIFPQTEDHPLNPTSYYGVSKLAGEKYCGVFVDEFGLDVTALRYFHVYGPRQNSDDGGGVIAIFSTQATMGVPITIHGDGTQERSFTYVGDLVNINMLAAVNPKAKGEVYNCASGISVTIQQLAEQIRNLAGRPDLEMTYDDWTPGDIKIFNVDNSKIKSLGHEFETSFEEGLKHTFEWYRSRV